MGNIKQNLFLAFVYDVIGFRLRLGVSILRAFTQSDDCGSRDELQLGVGNWEGAAAATRRDSEREETLKTNSSKES
jgi:hypothetical protein